MSAARGKRAIDALVSAWAGPSFRSAGFTKKHRVFTATGPQGVHLRIEFRLYPLPVRCDTFWFEWTSWTETDRSHLAARVPIPPLMCLDRAFNAVFPPDYAWQAVDLWRVDAETVESYGPLLAEQVGRVLPYWSQILAQSAPPGPAEDIWKCMARLRPPRTEEAELATERVVAGQLDSVEREIRHLVVRYPDNVWTQWWSSLAS